MRNLLMFLFISSHFNNKKSNIYNTEIVSYFSKWTDDNNNICYKWIFMLLSKFSIISHDFFRNYFLNTRYGFSDKWNSFYIFNVNLKRLSIYSVEDFVKKWLIMFLKYSNCLLKCNILIRNPQLRNKYRFNTI